MLTFIFLNGCAVARTTAKIGSGTAKTAWFIVGTTGKVTVKTAAITTKTSYHVASATTHAAVKTTVAVVDLTANTALRLAARRESLALAQGFWWHSQGGDMVSAYKLVTPLLRHELTRQTRNASDTKWTRNIRDIALGEPVIKPQHVETPVRLAVRAGQKLTHVSVRMFTILDKSGHWMIDGWDIIS